MTSGYVPNIESSPTITSTSKLNMLQQGGAPNIPPNSPKERVADMVSISSVSKNALINMKDVTSSQEKNQKKEINKVTDSTMFDGKLPGVQFVYNKKGDLSIRFMDTASKLIYQIPSEFMLSLKEHFAKSDGSVSTKA